MRDMEILIFPPPSLNVKYITDTSSYLLFIYNDKMYTNELNSSMQ